MCNQHCYQAVSREKQPSRADSVRWAESVARAARKRDSAKIAPAAVSREKQPSRADSVRWAGISVGEAVVKLDAREARAMPPTRSSQPAAARHASPLLPAQAARAERRGSRLRSARLAAPLSAPTR